MENNQNVFAEICTTICMLPFVFFALMMRFRGDEYLNQTVQEHREETERQRKAVKHEIRHTQTAREQFADDAREHMAQYQLGAIAAGNIPAALPMTERSPSAGSSEPCEGHIHEKRLKPARLYLELEAPADMTMPETVDVYFKPLGLARQDGYLFKIQASEKILAQNIYVVGQDHPFATYVEDVPDDVIKFIVNDNTPIDIDRCYKLRFKVEKQVDDKEHLIGERRVRFWMVYANGTTFPYRWDYRVSPDGTTATPITYEIDLFELMPV